MSDELVSSMEEFEKKLRESMNKSGGDNKSLANFEAQLKNTINPSVTPMQSNPVQPQQNKQTIKVRKNIVLSFPSDFTGCGHIRNIFPMTYLSNLYGKSGQLITMVAPFYIRQTDVLARARSLFFQRQMTKQQFNIVNNYKSLQHELKYKMVWDMDDMIWGKNELEGGTKECGVPSYNFGEKNIGDEVREWSVKIMNLMDTCCFSTQYLADYAKNVCKTTSNCVVVPNAIPKFFWGGMKKADRTQRKEKLRVLITSSPTHYHNQKKLKGDFDNAWLDWLLTSVKNEKIELVCMGGLPFFFEEIKDKIKVINWVSSFEYHTVVKKQKADICIGPLVPNDFNHAKSDIKYIESCANSTPFIGTTFTNGKPSPYDDCLLTVKDNCTVDDIEEIVEKLREPEFFNKIKNDQFDMLDKKGRWVESPEYIQRWLEII